MVPTLCRGESNHGDILSDEGGTGHGGAPPMLATGPPSISIQQRKKNIKPREARLVAVSKDPRLSLGTVM